MQRLPYLLALLTPAALIWAFFKEQGQKDSEEDKAKSNREEVI